MPGLRARGALLFAQAERTYRVAATTDTVDPLQADEWWLSQIGVDGLTPPGPGVPVSLVDSGLDFSHPEFAGRADTTALNTQEPASIGGEHGTSVASVIGAPQNGVGEVGIYPRAVLRSWDAAIGDGTQLESSEIAAGILAAARAGRGVINLSLGSDSPDLPIELAVSQAVALGSLVVAASGNDGDRGSPLGYPAAFPHVTTVAATDRSGNVASFSSRSSYVDLAAPGDEIIVASALGKNWRTASGTSFSSPLVAGAAAWIWTARPELTAGQVAEILRRSARDLGTPGRDSASGFGMLNVAAALALPAPIRDPYEPNDDVDEADPNGDRYVSKAPSLTTPTKRSARALRQGRHVRGPARRLPGVAPRREHLHGDAHRDHGRRPRAVRRHRSVRRGPSRDHRPARDRDDEGDGRAARVPECEARTLGVHRGQARNGNAGRDLLAPARRARPRSSRQAARRRPPHARRRAAGRRRASGRGHARA